MPFYTVVLRRLRRGSVVVEARNEDEAVDKVQEDIDEGDLGDAEWSDDCEIEVADVGT